MNIIGDFFQEPARIKSFAGYKTKSTLQYWHDSRLSKSWLLKLVSKRCEINTYELREAMYPVVKSEPTAFKASVASTIIRMLNAKKILDFCAGWGDRLIGALSCQDILECYYGIDPNEDLFKGYSEMIEEFNKSEIAKYNMVCSPFEKWYPENLSFDLVFTGPPYFDYEKYGSSGKGQSITSFPTFKEWVVHFLFYTIEKSWNLLEEGGFMALNVNDVKQLAKNNMIYTELMNLFIHYKLLNAKYEGVVSFTGAQIPLARPIWIYKKDSAHITSNVHKSAGQLMERYYLWAFEMIKK
jgi:hypothetical protein